MKRIGDYFEPAAKRQKEGPVAGDSRATKAAVTITKNIDCVPGLSILTAFVTPSEESRLLTFLDSQTWRTDLSRRAMHFGGTYCVMPPKGSTPAEKVRIENTPISAPPIPNEIEFIVDRMIDKGLYQSEDRPRYCIVNEYRSGQGISAHIENFRFGEPVCSLTLAGEDSMRFSELRNPDDGSVRSGKAGSAARTGKRHDISLARRSLAVLSGPARSKWQHEIVRGRKTHPLGWRRVSLTFRTERRDVRAP